jgi:hypothetical protein
MLVRPRTAQSSTTLTATAACRASPSSFSSLPVSGRGRVSIEGVVLCVGLGLDGGVGGRSAEQGLQTGGKPNTEDAQQDHAAADLRHVKSSVGRSGVLCGKAPHRRGAADSRQ